MKMNSTSCNNSYLKTKGANKLPLEFKSRGGEKCKRRKKKEKEKGI